MFIETISALGNDVLIPVDRIRYILSKYENKSHLICIYTEDGDFCECFSDVSNHNKRYESIKKMLKVKNS